MKVHRTGDEYVLNLLPKTKNKYLYRGKIWVDAKDFAVVRIEGEPAKKSLLLDQEDGGKAQIHQGERLLASRREPYGKRDTAGRPAILTIEYRDYRITSAAPAARLRERAPSFEVKRVQLTFLTYFRACSPAYFRTLRKCIV